MRTYIILLFLLMLSPLPVAANEQVDEVSINKTWSVAFNMPMDNTNVYENIFILDEDGEEMSVYIQPVDDGKVFEISPYSFDTYEVGEVYTLHVTDSLTSKQGEELKETVKKKFKIHSQETLKVSVENVDIGETTREEVEAVYGSAHKSESVEGKLTWASYHESYQNFFLVLYDNSDVVQGFYTNQDTVEIGGEWTIGSSFAEIDNLFGASVPLDSDDYTTHKQARVGGAAYTFYFDKHEDYKLTGVRAIAEEFATLQGDVDYAGLENSTTDVFEMQVFEVLNAFRVRHGEKPLVLDAAVSDVARAHSKDMAERGYFAHDTPEGVSPFERLDKAGIEGGSGENLIGFVHSGIAAMIGWENSYGHRMNLLSNADRFGIGFVYDPDSPYKRYYTQNFVTDRY